MLDVERDQRLKAAENLAFLRPDLNSAAQENHMSTAVSLVRDIQPF